MSEINLAPAILAMSQGATHTWVAESGNAKAPVRQDGNAKDPALWEVSLKFEAILMQQVMSAMHKTVPESGLLPSGFAGDMYSSMFNQAVAETSSKSGNLGIAESIYRQMHANNQTKENSISADIYTGNLTTRPEE